MLCKLYQFLLTIWYSIILAFSLHKIYLVKMFWRKSFTKFGLVPTILVKSPFQAYKPCGFLSKFQAYKPCGFLSKFQAYKPCGFLSKFQALTVQLVIILELELECFIVRIVNKQKFSFHWHIEKTKIWLTKLMCTVARQCTTFAFVNSLWQML
jgi:hypothetical protein